MSLTKRLVVLVEYEFNVDIDINICFVLHMNYVVRIDKLQSINRYFFLNHVSISQMSIKAHGDGRK